MARGRKKKLSPLLRLSVFRDPLYRYEVRRFWTPRKYVYSALVLLGWVALLGSYYFFIYYRFMSLPGVGNAGYGIGHIVIWTLIKLPDICRLPLCVLAVVYSATAIVPERVSGQIEQFVLTPMDPWRLGLARYAARLRGLASIWLVVGAIAVASLIAAIAAGAADMGIIDQRFGMFRDQLRVSKWVALAMVSGSVLMGQLSLALMVMLDAAVGLTFSARMRSTAAAVALACLVSFPLLGLILNIPGAIISAVGMSLVLVTGMGAGASTAGMAALAAAFPLFAGLSHAGLGVLALWLFLRWARRSVTAVFTRPGG